MPPAACGRKRTRARAPASPAPTASQALRSRLTTIFSITVESTATGNGQVANASSTYATAP